MQITLPETNEVRTIDGALTLEDLERLNQEFEGRAAEEILRWAYETFHPSLKLACSFGGATGMVLLDIAHKIEPDLKVFYIDTDFLFPETYALKDEVERRYGIRTEGIKSRWTPEGQAREFGEGCGRRTRISAASFARWSPTIGCWKIRWPGSQACAATSPGPASRRPSSGGTRPSDW